MLNNPCRLWPGRRNAAGYGVQNYQGRREYAHRVAFFVAHGRWPEPCCLHHCDTPACVEESHLFEGTHAQNVADKVAKGRQARGAPVRMPGERNGRARLTEAKVLSLIGEFVDGSSYAELATKYNVGRTTVRDAVSGRRWRGLTAQSLPTTVPVTVLVPIAPEGDGSPQVESRS